jgi:hypothetical protein
VDSAWRQAVVDVLNKSVETQHAVACLLSKKIRQSAEKSGKHITQVVESNETKVLTKLFLITRLKVGFLHGSFPFKSDFYVHS